MAATTQYGEAREDWGPMVDVTGARVLSCYILELTFDTGETKVIDVEPLLRGPVFEPVRSDGIREAMKNKAPYALVGKIVADETWIGPNPQRMNIKSRRRFEGVDEEPVRLTPGSRENQRTGKTPVMSLVDAETGEVRSRVVTDVTANTLRKVMAEQVDMARSTLHTDEGAWYSPIAREFAAHHAVNHNQGRYYDYGTGASTNKAENYFSQLKRSIDGTHHSLSKRHLQRYLWEFDFRYSTHKITDTERVARLMGQVEGRITYKRVKGL